MAKKKYQVFVSSTFVDMKDERQAAVEAILLSGHIPAGMELFSAGDESQLEVIKKWIEASDIYMLILGGRYGTIEPKSGLSYIEIEYNHATDLKKPFFALVLDAAAIDKKAKADGSNIEMENPDKLAQFRARVLSKISRAVEDHKDVKLYTVEAIKNNETRPELVGWIRADDAPDLEPVLQQITALTKSNQELREQVAAMEAASEPPPPLPDLAGMDHRFRVRTTYKSPGGSVEREKTFDMQLGRIFSLIAPKLLEHPNDTSVKLYLAKQLFVEADIDHWMCEMNEQDFQTIKVQLSALGLVDVRYAATVKGGMSLFWALTDTGQRELVNQRALRATKGG